jgi:thiol-disulfide isomerase/thioredoxin
VVEVYSNWCGPCKSVLPTFKKIRVDKDDEAALLFLTVPSESCSSMDLLKEHQGKSEPLFLLYRVRHGSSDSVHSAEGLAAQQMEGFSMHEVATDNCAVDRTFLSHVTTRL